MAYKKLRFNNEESDVITDLDQKIINRVIKTLTNCKDNVAKITNLYRHCQHDIKPNLHPYKIKCCIYMLRVKGLVKIVNKKGRKTNVWTTYIFLNKKKYEEIQMKKQLMRETEEGEEYNDSEETDT